ncbi:MULTISPECIES: hypothetical protein [unclassified Xanthomonas]|uniref:hypothetical protein n=1 Tax=unclassified Xanthomonas TaxID=2643310 RepID=UPI0025E749C8|nr:MULTISPECIES: hypothetical protein [unclassified Xanthomonas]MDY4297889.1 hypothetical protein [Xanthomonas sp. LF02-5]MDY4359774.1 hypothetical protein [Xanthomonas sp. LF04-12]
MHTITSPRRAAFLLLLLLPAAQADMTAAAAARAAPAEMTESDFAVAINNHSFALGERWSEQTRTQAGTQISESFVGDVPAGETSYKYYQHRYAGFDIYTANLSWQKEQRDIDSYVIAQITINVPAIRTARGIAIGDTQNVLINTYGQGTTDDSDGQHWRSYETKNKRLSFQLEHGRIIHIMMTLDTDS